MQSGAHLSADGDTSDDEEDDSGWLAHSKFELRPPPVQARQHNGNRRPLSESGFDVSYILESMYGCELKRDIQDSFAPPSSSSAGPFTDPFEDVSPAHRLTVLVSLKLYRMPLAPSQTQRPRAAQTRSPFRPRSQRIWAKTRYLTASASSATSRVPRAGQWRIRGI